MQKKFDAQTLFFKLKESDRFNSILHHTLAILF